MIKLPSKFVYNVFIGSGSMLLYAIALQIVVFPLLGLTLSSDRFGQIITSMALVNVAGMVIGGSYANLLLKKYGDLSGLQSDLNIKQYNSNFIFILIMFLPLLLIVGNIFLASEDIALTLLVAVLFSIKSYLQSGFRLEINYRKIAVSRAINVLGYFLGYAIFTKYSEINPMYIFLFGELIVIIHLLFATKLFMSGFAFKIDLAILKQFFASMVSSLSNNSVSYGDRFILSKGISFQAVPVFFAACVAGRMLQMFFNVVSNVVFSYLVNRQRHQILPMFIKIISLSVVIGVISYLFLSAINPVIIRTLYPSQFPQTIEIISFVNLAFSLKIVEIIIRPFFVRLFKLSSIAYLDSSIAAVYLIIASLAAVYYGIMGFAVAFFIYYLIKVAAFVLLCIYSGFYQAEEFVGQ